MNILDKLKDGWDVADHLFLIHSSGELYFNQTVEHQSFNLLDVQSSDISEYDRAGKINVSLLIEDFFSFQIDYDVLNEKDTIQSLYDFCSNQ